MNQQATERFSKRVENYIKYRPRYPRAVLDYLQATISLQNTHAVADIGSGTGIFTELLLQNGNTVYAIEPNKPMRLAAERLLSHHENFYSIVAGAEHTTLGDKSVDVITSAQAFHWFEPQATKKEWLRILKPHGHVVLLWNERLTDGTAFLKGYEELLHEFAIDYAKVDHRRKGNKENVTGFFADAKIVSHQLAFQRQLTLQQLEGLVLSASYMPDQEAPTYVSMQQKLMRLFERHQRNDYVRMNYITKIFTGTL